jgi:DNA-binding NarL/FixJ family response regulator
MGRTAHSLRGRRREHVGAVAVRTKRVLIVDDHGTVRSLLRQIVEGAGFAVAGEASDGSDAVRLVRELEPDAVTMDLEMPVMTGVEAIRVICSSADAPPIVIVSGSHGGELVGEALEAGARWHVAKEDVVDDLPYVLRALLGG